MGFFDNELEPGDDVLKPCPNCGEDRVYRTSDGIFDFSNGRIFAPVEYYCDSCGHMVDEDDVLKSYKEICSDNNDTEPPSILQKSADPDVSSIEHDELRKQVKDRIAEGWEIEEVDNSDRKVIMSTTKGGTIGGHALTALTTGGWTFGAGNIAYSKLSKKRNSESSWIARPRYTAQ